MTNHPNRNRIPAIEINVQVPVDRIANMMVSAMESGDPVTTAARGGWCSAINLLKGGRGPKGGVGCWYADPKLYAGYFEIEVIEVDDENTGHETKHKVCPADLLRGLSVMAAKFPRAFAQVLADDTDAPCADAFLQSIVFGEEKYA
jgi:hypothetical protein